MIPAASRWRYILTRQLEWSPRIGEKAKRIALLGDSLSTAAHIDSNLRMVQLARAAPTPNWFIEDPHGAIGSVINRLAIENAITACYVATASGAVGACRFKHPLVDQVIGARHFHQQVDTFLRLTPLPDILLIWLGHNDMDWVLAKGFSLAEIAVRFREAYAAQLRRILDYGAGPGRKMCIVVFGLINFPEFFTSRNEAESLRREDSRLYPYFDRCYEIFPSMLPESRDGMAELAELCNTELQKLVEELRGELGAGSWCCLSFSRAFSDVKLGRASHLCPADGWHPSLEGHRALATSAYPVVEEHLPHTS